MTGIFTPNKTSGRLLVDYAKRYWHVDTDNVSAECHKRYLMVYDLYIKARSFALINKIAFWLAIIAGILVLTWPALAVVSKDFGFEKDFLKSAMVQTTVTALAAMLFALYSHYKKRQMHMENLMRLLIYSPENETSLLDTILKELEKMDSGFSFSASIMNKQHTKTDDQ
ncbi:hypothetical protein QX776_00995 [Alteromonadaceae bacterium BrNp21-10]|nr:hypothetical protein [Alteromonadaceae bacterium BrNp21-10]